MNWNEANDWAAALEYHDIVRNVTYSDWRLPMLTDLGSLGACPRIGIVARESYFEPDFLII
ncbi:MAG: hypothetical protein CTY19_07575 [Methylomonas sp.]|nr:MAG: hypothetical protein CTY19_07575 [Methylomonas sp.]